MGNFFAPPVVLLILGLIETLKPGRSKHGSPSTVGWYWPLAHELSQLGLVPVWIVGLRVQGLGFRAIWPREHPGPS